MSKITVVKTKDFTVMSNRHLRDNNLSFKAKGILSLMLSLPDDWDYTINGLSYMAKDKKDSVITGLRELEDNKYLVRKKVRDSSGKFVGYDYMVYENPTDGSLEENPKEETPISENPSSENPLLINTNIQNTELQNTDKQTKNDISKDISKEKGFLFANEVIQYLNSKANKKFRTNTKAYIRLINARLSEGYTLEDFKHVIDVKCAEWMNTDHEQYLRPDTLFAPSHFDSYLNQKIVKAKPKSAIYFSNDECREQMKNETPTF